ncbi:GDSL-like lipase/Acylhydrolase family domain-containing protein [Ditylenchus destructor]|nr:GDSL-like lipase/Acylhydrolase family domain-containing protein [Ditylenchus destructor]
MQYAALPMVCPSTHLYQQTALMTQHLFGMFNTWAQLPLFRSPTSGHNVYYNSAEKLRPVTIAPIAVDRMRRLSNTNEDESYLPWASAGVVPIFVNDELSYRRNMHLVRVSVCHDGAVQKQIRNNSNGSSALRFLWKFSSTGEQNDGQQQPTMPFSSGNCSLVVQLSKQGTYYVNLEVEQTFATGGSRALFVSKVKQPIRIHDYWIVALGDSFASGEGNPDLPVQRIEQRGNRVSSNYIVHPARWISEKCHRSTKSWPFKVYEKLLALGNGHHSVIHFSFLACAGASVARGISSSSEADNDAGSESSQLDKVRGISQIRGSGPDLLLMSVGGNDLGYSDILARLLQGGDADTQSLQLRFFYVSTQLDRLGSALATLGGKLPLQVVTPHYFDISRNERGIVDTSCADLEGIHIESLRKAERLILKRLNRMITEKGEKFGWTVVGDEVDKLFKTTGMCSSRSLIRNSEDSLRLQGDYFGAFHPTEEAHSRIAEHVFRKVNFRALLPT